MNNAIFPHLKFINFKDISYWTTKRFFAKELMFSKKYPLKLFGYFLEKITPKTEQIEDEKNYPIIGVRSYGLGAYINRISLGKNLKMKKYQLAEENHLIWCKVDTKNGAFAIVTSNLRNSYASSNMALAKIDNSKIINDYLQLIFKSKKIQKYLDSFVSGTTNRKYIKIDELLSKIQIPLPSLEIQEEFVKKYNDKIKLAEEQETKVLQLENDIEKYLFRELDIDEQTKENEIQNKNLLSFTDLKNLSRWGVEYLKTQKSDNTLLKSRTISMRKLGSIVEIDPKNNFSALNKDLEMSFIPMQCISDEYGEIVKLENGINEKSKGYTRFQEGDLVWAKITPCMQNGKSAILKGLKNGYGYGSTEFYVIRNSNSNICLDYIYHILRTKLVRWNAVKYFTGSSGQQRVPKSYLQNLEIPLPDFDKQKNISNQIYAIKMKIKKLKQEAEQNRIAAQEEFEKELFE